MNLYVKLCVFPRSVQNIVNTVVFLGKWYLDYVQNERHTQMGKH